MPALTTSETESILTLCLMASFADGDKHERERQQMKKITDSLAGGEVDFTALYQEVLLNKPEISAVAARLVTPGSRQLAYEMQGKALAEKYTGQISEQSQQLQGAGIATLVKGAL